METSQQLSVLVENLLKSEKHEEELVNIIITINVCTVLTADLPPVTWPSDWDSLRGGPQPRLGEQRTAEGMSLDWCHANQDISYLHHNYRYKQTTDSSHLTQQTVIMAARLTSLIYCCWIKMIIVFPLIRRTDWSLLFQWHCNMSQWLSHFCVIKLIAGWSTFLLLLQNHHQPAFNTDCQGDLTWDKIS